MCFLKLGFSVVIISKEEFATFYILQQRKYFYDPCELCHNGLHSNERSKKDICKLIEKRFY